MNISITLQFSSAAEAAEALNRLAVPATIATFVSPAVTTSQPAAVVGLTPPAVIAPVDNPAVGADTTNPFAKPALVAPVLQAPAALTLPSAATVQTAAPGLVLDSEGLPWDARIHGETKTQNKDGTWRAKRGLNDGAMVQRVKAELLALVAASPAAAAAAPVLAPPTVAPVLTPPVQPAPVVMAPPQTEVAAIPLAPPAATGATVPAGTPVTFLQLFTLVNDSVKAGKLNDDMVIAVLKPYGLGGVTQSASRPDIIPALHAEFAAMVGA